MKEKRSLKQVDDADAKKILVKILKNFHLFCEKQDLHYSLAGGTLIGALRHKGFIPWDDDIDVFMPRDDYEKFLRLYRSDEYYLITSGKGSMWSDAYSRLSDKNTIVYWDDYTSNHGLWLAILPIDGYPGDKVWNENLGKLQFWSGIGRLKQSCWVNVSSPIRNIAKAILKIVLKPIPQAYVAKKIKNIIARYPLGSTKELGNNSTYMLGKLFVPHHFDGDCMDDYIEVEFEGLKVMAMAGYDKYLTKIFGDWHQLPPEEQRVSHGYTAYYIDNI